MAKKDLKDAATTSADIMDTIAAGGAKDTQNTKPKKSRLNLNMPMDCRDYLAQRAYDESSPKHTVSITEYLINLIRKDMQEHGEK